MTIAEAIKKTSILNGNRKEPKCSIYDKLLVIEGYFCRFNKRSKLLHETMWGTTYRFTETIDKGALDKALNKFNNGTKACSFKIDHKTPYNGTLQLSKDELGGKFTFRMANTPHNKKLYDKVNKRELTETSFAFGIVKKNQSIQLDPHFKEGNIYSRRIYELEHIVDVSVVKTPAYTGNGINTSVMCSTGNGVKNTRGVNNYHTTEFASLTERAIEVQKLADKYKTKKPNQTMENNKETIREQVFNQFTGVPGLSGNATIKDASRMVDTANLSITTQLVEAIVHNNPTSYRAQLERSGLNFLQNGKVNRVNTNDFRVDVADEHAEFPLFDDLTNLKPETFTAKRIGATFIVSNELLASTTFVNSLVQQADNEIFACALAYLIDQYKDDFTEVLQNPFTAEFVEGALVQVKSTTGVFVAKELDLIAQLFTPHGANKNVVNAVAYQQFKTASGNNIMYGVDKYLTEPTRAYFGDFRYAFMNLITGLEVTKNTFTYAKNGDTEVTFFREIGIAITETGRFCKSQLPV